MTPIKLNQWPLMCSGPQRLAQRGLADEAQGIDLLAERVEHRLAVGVHLLGKVGRRRRAGAGSRGGRRS